MTASLHTIPPCWDETGALEENVRQLIGKKAQPEDTGRANPSPAPKVEGTDSGSRQDGPNSECYASFGDHGTTATVGAFGQLLQFSDYLGAKNSGVFCADHDGTDEPYFVQRRADQLHERLRDPFNFGPAPPSDPPYGLRFPGLILNSSVQPHLEWTNWRWPCHQYALRSFKDHPNLKLTIQWMVHEKTVLQRCLVQNNGEDFQLDVEFSKSMKIRDLDHLEPFNRFNDEIHNEVRPGPRGYSWVCFQRFQGRSVASENATPYGVSITCAVAINGETQTFENEVTPQKWSFLCQGRRPGATNESSHTVEVITAYKMTLLQTPKGAWETHIIPWNTMKVIQSVLDKSPDQSLPARFSGSSWYHIAYMGQAVGTYLRGASNRIPEDTKLSTEMFNKIGTAGNQTGRFTSKVPFNTLEEASPPKTLGSPLDNLVFAVRRNLEHILSVCAVQTFPTGHHSAFNSLPKALKSVEATALTCGDMSGHRICWSASFFAFRFLVEFYKIIQSQPIESREDELLVRIQKTCRGHLRWLHLVQQENSGQRFGANYWVTGRLMNKHRWSQSWVAQESLLDTAFQIIKAEACMELWDDQDTGSEVASGLMSDWAPSWLLAMKNSDKREKYAWRHAEEEGVNTFRLDDHVWIWRALKSLERNEHRAWSEMSDQTRKEEENGSLERQFASEIEDLRKKFSSKNVRREVSRRFTTENTLVRKRMLATTRSVRESRFMLHARDTALLYTEMIDFLGEDSSVEPLWKTTVQSQKYHTEEQDSSWEKTLRHALYIMLGSQDLSINNAPPNELVRAATDIVLRSSSLNGFFPGRASATLCILPSD